MQSSQGEECWDLGRHLSLMKDVSTSHIYCASSLFLLVNVEVAHKRFAFSVVDTQEFFLLFLLWTLMPSRVEEDL